MDPRVVTVDLDPTARSKRFEYEPIAEGQFANITWSRCQQYGLLVDTGSKDLEKENKADDKDDTQKKDTLTSSKEVTVDDKITRDIYVTGPGAQAGGKKDNLVDFLSHRAYMTNTTSHDSSKGNSTVLPTVDVCPKDELRARGILVSKRDEAEFDIDKVHIQSRRKRWWFYKPIVTRRSDDSMLFQDDDENNQDDDEVKAQKRYEKYVRMFDSPENEEVTVTPTVQEAETMSTQDANNMSASVETVDLEGTGKSIKITDILSGDSISGVLKTQGVASARDKEDESWKLPETPKWFSLTNIHPIIESISISSKWYKSIRNSIVKAYSVDPERYLTLGECWYYLNPNPKNLPPQIGDSDEFDFLEVSKIYNVLNEWGLINNIALLKETPPSSTSFGKPFEGDLIYKDNIYDSGIGRLGRRLYSKEVINRSPFSSTFYGQKAQRNQQSQMNPIVANLKKLGLSMDDPRFLAAASGMISGDIAQAVPTAVPPPLEKQNDSIASISSNVLTSEEKETNKSLLESAQKLTNDAVVSIRKIAIAMASLSKNGREYGKPKPESIPDTMPEETVQKLESVVEESKTNLSTLSTTLDKELELAAKRDYEAEKPFTLRPPTSKGLVSQRARQEIRNELKKAKGMVSKVLAEIQNNESKVGSEEVDIDSIDIEESTADVVRGGDGATTTIRVKENSVETKDERPKKKQCVIVETGTNEDLQLLSMVEHTIKTNGSGANVLLTGSQSQRQDMSMTLEIIPRGPAELPNWGSIERHNHYDDDEEEHAAPESNIIIDDPDKILTGGKRRISEPEVKEENKESVIKEESSGETVAKKVKLEETATVVNATQEKEKKLDTIVEVQQVGTPVDLDACIPCDVCSSPIVDTGYIHHSVGIKLCKICFKDGRYPIELSSEQFRKERVFVKDFRAFLFGESITATRNGVQVSSNEQSLSELVTPPAGWNLEEVFRLVDLLDKGLEFYQISPLLSKTEDECKRCFASLDINTIAILDKYCNDIGYENIETEGVQPSTILVKNDDPTTELLNRAAYGKYQGDVDLDGRMYKLVANTIERYSTEPIMSFIVLAMSMFGFGVGHHLAKFVITYVSKYAKELPKKKVEPASQVTAEGVEQSVEPKVEVKEEDNIETEKEDDLSTLLNRSLDSEFHRKEIYCGMGIVLGRAIKAMRRQETLRCRQLTLALIEQRTSVIENKSKLIRMYDEVFRQGLKDISGVELEILKAKRLQEQQRQQMQMQQQQQQQMQQQQMQQRQMQQPSPQQPSHQQPSPQQQQQLHQQMQQ